MRIVFATSLGAAASTTVGRILPLAAVWRAAHDVHLLGVGQGPAIAGWHSVGQEAYIRTAHGKKRYRGLRLIANMSATSWRTFFQLWRLRPDCIIISKPLPANTLGVVGYILLKKCRVVLDADDFELAANQLRSSGQRLVLHASERAAVRCSQGIIVATPFLQDHYLALSFHRRPVHLIPTGIFFPAAPLPVSSEPVLLYLGSISISSGHRVDLLPAIMHRVRRDFPQATLIMAGSGDDIEQLKRAFTELGVQRSVQWTGRFGSKDIPALIRRAAIVIDPIDTSLAVRAKSSFRVVVAAAYGRAIVSSNVGIVPQLIPRQFHQRFFARAGDPQSYAEKISALLRQGLRPDEQDVVYQHASQFSWEKLGREYEQFLQKI